MTNEHAEARQQQAALSKLKNIMASDHQVPKINLGTTMIRQTVSSISASSTDKRNGSSTITSLIADALHIIDTRQDQSQCKDDEVTVASTVSSSSFHVGKKVRFDTSLNEMIANEEHCLTDEICAAAWYNEEERRSMKSKREIGQSEEKEWKQSLSQVLEFCDHAPLHFNFTEEDLQEKAKSVFETEFRGLEGDTVAMLTSMRRKHSSNVLTYTDRVPKKLPQDLRDRMIATRSLQFSRPQLLFAQVMAQIDRNAVLGIE
ncbi:MAG: hypothetical protein SGILL_002010 [Bacillariaceae sp.]